MEHFTHSPQKLETGKHLTKQVWSRLLEERRGLLVSSFVPLHPCKLPPPHPLCCVLTPRMCTRL